VLSRTQEALAKMQAETVHAKEAQAAAASILVQIQKVQETDTKSLEATGGMLASVNQDQVGCYSGVPVVLHWCDSGVTMVLSWCHSGVPVVSHTHIHVQTFFLAGQAGLFGELLLQLFSIGGGGDP
jgi:hypothetical protein